VSQPDPDPEPATGDQTDARRLHASLQRLRRSPDPVLRDLADDLLAGRLSLRDVTTNNQALPLLQRGLDRYTEWRKSVSDQEFAQLVDRAQHIDDQLSAEDGDGHG